MRNLSRAKYYPQPGNTPNQTSKHFSILPASLVSSRAPGALEMNFKYTQQECDRMCSQSLPHTSQTQCAQGKIKLKTNKQTKQIRDQFIWKQNLI